MALRVRIPFSALDGRSFPTGALVADDDPIVKGNEAFLEPAEPAGVERATAAPGEKRTVTKAPAKPRGAAKKAAK